jgi:hypothetical protein
VGDPAPANSAAFTSGGPAIAGLTTANVQVQYLDVNGAPIANAAGNFSSIRYVNVSIVGFRQTLFIPTLTTTVPMNGFSTTLPRESLGVTPTAVTSC